MQAHNIEWTVGEIARHFCAPVHRVAYLIQARGIKPTSRAGILRIFRPEDVELIGRELVRLDQPFGQDGSADLAVSEKERM